jgi:hypothetical protein
MSALRVLERLTKERLTSQSFWQETLFRKKRQVHQIYYT